MFLFAYMLDNDDVWLVIGETEVRALFYELYFCLICCGCGAC